MFYCMACRKFLLVPGFCAACGSITLAPAAVHVPKPRPFLALVPPAPEPQDRQVKPSGPPRPPQLHVVRSSA